MILCRFDMSGSVLSAHCSLWPRWSSTFGVDFDSQFGRIFPECVEFASSFLRLWSSAIGWLISEVCHHKFRSNVFLC